MTRINYNDFVLVSATTDLPYVKSDIAFVGKNENTKTLTNKK